MSDAQQFATGGVYRSGDNIWLDGVAQAEIAVGISRGLRLHHSADRCEGEHCCIHNPSDHPLRDEPLHWRSDRRLMERVCQHGCGHSDPDDLAHKRRILGEQRYRQRGFEVHGCCGCCREPEAAS